MDSKISVYAVVAFSSGDVPDILKLDSLNDTQVGKASFPFATKLYEMLVEPLDDHTVLIDDSKLVRVFTVIVVEVS